MAKAKAPPKDPAGLVVKTVKDVLWPWNSHPLLKEPGAHLRLVVTEDAYHGVLVSGLGAVRAVSRLAAPEGVGDRALPPGAWVLDNAKAPKQLAEYRKADPELYLHVMEKELVLGSDDGPASWMSPPWQPAPPGPALFVWGRDDLAPPGGEGVRELDMERLQAMETGRRYWLVFKEDGSASLRTKANRDAEFCLAVLPSWLSWCKAQPRVLLRREAGRKYGVVVYGRTAKTKAAPEAELRLRGIKF